MSTRFPIFGFISAALLIPNALFAQLDTGNITVEVRDSSGLPIAGANVTLRNDRTGVDIRTAATNEQGAYVFN